METLLIDEAIHEHVPIAWLIALVWFTPAVTVILRLVEAWRKR